MDLNELLRAHQIEVMKLAATDQEGAGGGHFGRIAEYANRIRALRNMGPQDAVALHQSAAPMIIYGTYAGVAPEGADLPRASENPDQGCADD